MTGAFPFRAARPKGAPQQPQPSRPPMAFELPEAPPETTSPPQEVVFEQSTEPEDFKPQEEDMAKKRRGRPPKAAPAPRAPRTPRESKITAKFTFAEVVEVLGEDVPFVKVVARIAPVIEVLPPADRKRVVDILVRLYG